MASGSTAQGDCRRRGRRAGAARVVPAAGESSIPGAAAAAVGPGTAATVGRGTPAGRPEGRKPEEREQLPLPAGRIAGAPLDAERTAVQMLGCRAG
jgi:hypothetical protein